jgi:N-acetylglutamate synthase-like GNAT family acetyltransferase
MLVEPAAFNDHVAICELLHAARLPVPDAGEHPVHILVVREGGEIIACAGWEAYGDSVLMRSIAVKPEVQRHGVGRALVSAALDGLSQSGVRAAFLVTTDAADFFAHLGFERCERASMPKKMRDGQPSSSGCASAVCMRLAL